MWLASLKTYSVEELETLHAGTKPRAPHHWSPGGQMHRKRKHSRVFLERMKKGHRQSGTHWQNGTISKARLGKPQRDRAKKHIIMGFPKHLDTILNCTEEKTTGRTLHLTVQNRNFSQTKCGSAIDWPEKTCWILLQTEPSLEAHGDSSSTLSSSRWRMPCT